MRKSIRTILIIIIFLINLPAYAIDLVPWETLAKYLPDSLNGLPRSGEVNGSTMEGSGMNISSASQNYGDGEGQVMIMHSPQLGRTQFTARMAMAKQSIDGPEGTMISKDIKGFPAILVYNKKEKSANAIIMLENDIQVTVTIESADSIDEVEKAAEFIDFQGLSSLQP